MIGETLGHYRILRPLGKGGMGEVFAAEDTKLGRTVALKVLPPELSQDPDRRQRFEREARAVAALNHPHIVTIYSVEEADGVPFLTMELIEGRPLSELIPPQGLPLERFLQLAVPLADAVSAAHQRGIVHRDLKPANVMVTDDGRLKVLDFGLARLKEVNPGGEGVSSLPTREQTGDGRIVGTAAYMSPEQAEGKPVDARSDVFSLGILLYEMTTGRRPFRGETSVATLSSILKDTPAPVGDLRPELPSEAGRIIRRCLEKDPARRMQTALDLRNELEDLKKDSDSGPAMRSVTAVAGTGLSQPSHARRWLWIVVGAAGVALAAGGLAVWRTRTRETVPSGPTPNKVVVTVFENRTGDPSLDPVGVLVAERLVQGIAETGFVEVLPNPVTSREPAQVVGKANGAGTVLSGAYYLQGDDLQFQATITNARDGKVLFPLDPVRGAKAAAAETIEPLRQRVMGAIAVRFDTAVFFPHTRPPLYDAYREYMAGLDLFLKDFVQAETHLRRAIRLDPEYFWPRLQLFYNHLLQGQYDKADAVLQEILPHRERCSPFERLWLDAAQAETAGKMTDRAALMRQMEKLEPSLPSVAMDLGIYSMAINQPQVLVTAYSKVDFPTSWLKYQFGEWPFDWLSQAHHMLGNYAAELAEVRRGRQHYPDDLGLRAAEARALAALGRLGEMKRGVEESLSLPSDHSQSPGDVLGSTAEELRAHGHKEEALAMARSAAAWVRSRPPDIAGSPTVLKALGRALFLAEEWDQARTVFAEVATKAANDIEATGYLGVLAARKGDWAGAHLLSEKLRALKRPYLFGEHTAWRAAIAAQLGEKDQAVDLLRESFAEGQNYGVWVHRDVTLEPLRGYPAYEELVRPKG
jgi:tetratricopeptide (TPR) repeat protein/predicted Ser/Thr protein kinase